MRGNRSEMDLLARQASFHEGRVPLEPLERRDTAVAGPIQNDASPLLCGGCNASPGDQAEDKNQGLLNNTALIIILPVDAASPLSGYGSPSSSKSNPISSSMKKVVGAWIR